MCRASECAHLAEVQRLHLGRAEGRIAGPIRRGADVPLRDDDDLDGLGLLRVRIAARAAAADAPVLGPSREAEGPVRVCGCRNEGSGRDLPLRHRACNSSEAWLRGAASVALTILFRAWRRKL